MAMKLFAHMLRSEIPGIDSDEPAAAATPDSRRWVFRDLVVRRDGYAAWGLSREAGAVAMPLKGMAVAGMTEFRRMGAALCATSVLLLAAQSVGRRRGEGGLTLEEIRPRDASAIGACQALSAIFHGLSRSGNTIAVGLFSGLSRKAAAEFSFLLSIPTILAAAAAENLHAYRHHTGPLSDGSSLPAYAVGMLVAAVVGYFTVGFLLKVVISMRLTPFVVYCAVLGVALLVFGGRLENGLVADISVGVR